MGYEELMLPRDILNERIYVHYQRDNSKLPVEFDPKLMNTHLDIPVRYLWAEKPSPRNFGLWASHVDAEFGWKDWATGEDFTSCEDNQAMYFKFRPGARIIFVDSVKKFDELPMINLEERLFREKGLDWETITKVADGLEIIFSSDWRLRDRLYSWDCDSIITWNPYMITPCGVDEIKLPKDFNAPGDILDGFNEKPYNNLLAEVVMKSMKSKQQRR